MYGEDYGDQDRTTYEVDNGHQPERVLRILDIHTPGTFVDFGCGDGSLLRQASDRGWNCIGVEFHSDLAASVSKRSGLTVRTYADICRKPDPVADVLHAGDVLEHLTMLDEQIALMLRLLKPGGLFLAQGPLEANTNAFTALLRLYGTIRPYRVIAMPPWHVTMASAQGQKTLFSRAGLTELTFFVSEVSWPAPSRLNFNDVRHPRSVALFLARRLSVTTNKLRGTQDQGNRYFYIGTCR
jgi:SAM-dependent methyltransferase